MDELHRDAGDHRRIRPGRAREVDEQRAQPLATRGERLAADLRDDSLVAADRMLEPIFELGQVRLEARCLAQLGEGGQWAVPVCSATIPPAKVRKRTSRKPAVAIRFASSSGPGNRRTLAGRYV